MFASFENNDTSVKKNVKYVSITITHTNFQFFAEIYSKSGTTSKHVILLVLSKFLKLFLKQIMSDCIKDYCYTRVGKHWHQSFFARGI